MYAGALTFVGATDVGMFLYDTNGQVFMAGGTPVTFNVVTNCTLTNIGPCKINGLAVAPSGFKWTVFESNPIDFPADGQANFIPIATVDGSLEGLARIWITDNTDELYCDQVTAALYWAAMEPQPATLNIAPWAGITITGTVGATYSVEYVNDVSSTNWTLLTNIVLTSTSATYFEPVSAASHRFYRAVAP